MFYSAFKVTLLHFNLASHHYGSAGDSLHTLMGPALTPSLLAQAQGSEI